MPQDSKLKISGWRKLMTAFDLMSNTEMYDVLRAAYSEKHRAYHTLDHIKACFRHLEPVSHMTDSPHEIELALWFHDAIYKPFSSTNEDDSAALAKAFLDDNLVSPEISTRIEGLIILTKDHGQPQSLDEKFILDIDLSILGSKPEVYAQFEKDIRKEYKRVPAFIFKKKRKEVLQSFQARPRIYHTNHFFDHLEGQARHNLSWAIDRI